MNDLAEILAVRLARAWVSLYTRGLPDDIRHARCAEIESDLWEHRHYVSVDGSGGFTAGILGRVLAGILADISWSVEERGTARRVISMDDPWYGQRRLQNHIIPGISVLVVMAALVTMVGLPTAASALIAGFVVLAMVGLTRGLVGSPVGMVSGEEGYMGAGTYRSRRMWLLVVLGVSMAVLVGTAAYAFSLESWGDTRGIVFNIVGFVSMAVGLVVLVLLIADFARARRG